MAQMVFYSLGFSGSHGFSTIILHGFVVIVVLTLPQSYGAKDGQGESSKPCQMLKSRDAS
jgi:hypothetical protein